MRNVSDARVSERLIGDLEVAVIHAGLLHIPPQPPWRMEGSGYSLDDEGRPITGINGLLVTSGGAVVLVDPNSWEHGGIVESKMAVTFLAPGPPIEASLAALGVEPAQVTHVVITHGHWDHYSATTDAAGKVRFPNARHLFPAADWQAFAVEDQRSDAALLRSHLDPVSDAGLLELLTGDHALSETINVLSAPGESPGHQVVRFAGSAGPLYYLGDLFHFPAEFAPSAAPEAGAGGPGRDPIRTRASQLGMLERIEDDGPDATLVFTHGVFPAWGRVERTGASAWRWSYTG